MLNNDEALYFNHIPKTAGTTLRQLIDRYFGIDEIMPAMLWRDLSKVSVETVSKFRLYRGHFGARGLDQILPKRTKRMTMLRHPFPLVYSAFEFGRRAPEHEISDLIKSMDFQGYLSDPRTLLHASNRLVRDMSAEFESAAQLTDLFELNSPAEVDDWLRTARQMLSVDQQLDAAVANLDRCECFGLVEYFEESLALFSYTFGWPPIRSVQKLNVGRAGQKVWSFAPAVIERITELNQADLRFYEYAKGRFFKLYCQMVEELGEYDHNETLESDSHPPPSVLYPLLDKHYQKCRRNRRNVALGRRDFSGPLWGDGWHGRQPAGQNSEVFRWTGPSPVSTIDFEVAKHRDTILRIHIVDSSSPELLKTLQLFANGDLLPWKRIVGGNRSSVIEAKISHRSLGKAEFLRLTLSVCETVNRNAHNEKIRDTRDVGIAVKWIELEPVMDEIPTFRFHWTKKISQVFSRG